MHLVYPGRYPVFPRESGRTFQHVFGRTTSYGPRIEVTRRAAETFALECGVKGPQWLEIGGVSVSPSKKSFCQHEFAVPEIRGNLQVLAELPPPTLRVLSLELSAITRPDNNQTQICAATAAVYEGIDIVRDTDRTHQTPVRGCCVRTGWRRDV